MTELLGRCQGCGNLLDIEDTFCGNCGRESAVLEAASTDEIEAGFVGFDCETCGASLTYDAATEGLLCSFCGSVRMRRQPASTGRVRPASYVPFEISEGEAIRLFKAWISTGLFRPIGIGQAAKLTSMRPVFIPFWVFRASTHTYFVADSSRTPFGARADWYPVFGEHAGGHEGVLVCASGALQEVEVRAIEPFDSSRRVAYERDHLRAHAVEDFGLSRRGARARVRRRLDELERQVCASLVPGRSRNVHVNVLAREMRSEPALLPVWINAYRYRERTYRFCVNGQTGAIVGNAPVSLAKLAILVAAIAVVVLALALAFV